MTRLAPTLVVVSVFAGVARAQDAAPPAPRFPLEQRLADEDRSRVHLARLAVDVPARATPR